MASDLPLTPHLEKFVRDQLGTGRFQSRSDMICAALSLFEQRSQDAGEPKPSPTADAQMCLPHQQSEPVSKERRERLRPSLRKDAEPIGAGTAMPVVRRSPRGILADLASHIGPDEIKEARSKMWSGTLNDQAG
jgi:Arc/MetJ-type ribon-helix-helix transcriptional regulator